MVTSDPMRLTSGNLAAYDTVHPTTSLHTGKVRPTPPHVVCYRCKERIREMMRESVKREREERA